MWEDSVKDALQLLGVGHVGILLLTYIQNKVILLVKKIYVHSAEILFICRSNPTVTRLQVQYTDHSATLPPYKMNL